ncbi:hypothetical protein [Glycomyces xiaoerkulensis]|uniref:hypothetical protein n=1 Tax=Glycomyces xiaoerkulensis TaxID=2038139 RepID=UPI000C265AC7|nr:hypothetical protein [Glycomyces xiaoerkulensis]
MTSIFAEAWQDTRRDARRGARRWLRRHPATNLFAWGAATVAYTLPKRAIVASHRAGYRKRVTTTGRPPAATAATTTATTTTVTATSRSGISQKTVTTTTGTGVIHMSATSRLLGTSDLARAYSAVIDQIGDWAPIQNFAANSIVGACTDLKASIEAVGSGFEDLSLTFQIGNIDDRVHERVTAAIGLLGSAGESIKRAAEAMGRIYTDQINQEASNVPMAGMPLVGGAHAPLETQVPATRAALLVSAWLPEQGNVVNGVWTHLATNKFAMTLWGRTLDDLADRLARYGVHQKVRRHLADAADDLKAAGNTLHGAQRAFMNLYRHQGAAESVAATVTPIDR